MSVNEMLMAAAGSAGGAADYVEDVFSTWLYTGNGSTQTITNGIDLSNKGGLVWTKRRNLSSNQLLIDTVRGGSSALLSNLTNAAYTGSTYINPFNSTGYNITESDGDINASGGTYCSWTFRKQAKFFDVVTYTGNGASNRQISHSLGSTPGMMIVKVTSGATGNWGVYHRSLGATKRLFLNLTDSENTNSLTWNDTEPTSTNFTVGSSGLVNGDGLTYVAYLFAHDAGGFGTAGTDNIITCGSFTTNGSGNATVSLGYEPQWLLVKNSSGSSNWWIVDNMRGFSQTTTYNLNPNTSGTESTTLNGLVPTATGFQSNGALDFNTTYIYMAIRRPMKVPTTGTSVFKPVARTGTDSSVTIDAGFPVDLNIASSRDKNIQSYTPVIDRLRGGGVNYRYLNTQLTDAETTGTASGAYEFTQNGVYTYNTAFNSSSETYVHWMFKRAPGFFDIVCYTGQNSTNQRVAHNLTVAPELIFIKSRNTAGSWYTYSATQGRDKYGQLESTAAFGTYSNIWGTTNPTSTDFGVSSTDFGFGSGTNVVAYLFSTLAGVSKVGSYTGDGTDGRVINCGFTGGARFVLIKRTDGTGNWRVWDTARGIVSGNDPLLALNNINAEVTNSDDLDPSSSGFIVNYNGNSAINESGWTYIFLAIA